MKLFPDVLKIVAGEPVPFRRRLLLRLTLYYWVSECTLRQLKTHPVVRAFALILVGGYAIIFTDNFADTYTYATQIEPVWTLGACQGTPGEMWTRGRVDWLGNYWTQIKCPASSKGTMVLMQL
jgi:hypothetical protein